MCFKKVPGDKTEGLDQKTGRAEARVPEYYSLSLGKRKRLHYVVAEGIKIERFGTIKDKIVQNWETNQMSVL